MKIKPKCFASVFPLIPVCLFVFLWMAQTASAFDRLLADKYFPVTLQDTGGNGVPVFTLAPPATLPIPTNAPGPFQALLQILPGWDPTLTNTFHSGDLCIDAVPLWKSQTAAGSTPYLSTAASYYFTRNFGAEGELISLGDGTGKSTIDSVAILGIVRKDIGNIAGQLLVGPCRDLHRGRFGADVGVGIVYRYKTGIEFKVDTRWRYLGNSSADNGFLTRVGFGIAL